MADVLPTTGSVPMRYDNEIMEADIQVDSNGIIRLDDGLETAVMISLFTDRLAEEGDDYQPGVAGARRGYWGDVLFDDDMRWGSRLWLLDRSKRTNQSLIRAVDYAKEALQWMIDEGIFTDSDLTVEAEFPTSLGGHAVDVNSAAILLTVTIRRPGELSETWSKTWELT